MMNFYYDPLFGLKYNYLESFILLDINVLPQNLDFDIEYWKKLLYQQKIIPIDSASNINSISTIGEITNYIL